MEKNKQFGPLVRWLQVNFGELFAAWIHVKALRVFVESVLRYGLPVNFQGMLVHPQKKTVKRLKEVLNQLYSHLDSGGAGGNIDVKPKFLRCFFSNFHVMGVFFRWESMKFRDWSDLASRTTILTYFSS